MSPKLSLLAVFAGLFVALGAISAHEQPAALAKSDWLFATPRETPALFFVLPKYAPTTAEREIVAACLVLEAANQGDFGMRSVMAVIRNRARGLPELLAPTVLRPKQFSALNKLTSGRESLSSMLARAKRDSTWKNALSIVEDALGDAWHDPTRGATHYTRTGEQTAWARRLAKTVTIGAHSFYR